MRSSSTATTCTSTSSAELDHLTDFLIPLRILNHTVTIVVMNGSTVLTIGTALSRAEQAGATVSALVQGQWIAGRVLGIDGHGVVLTNEEGESAVLRLEHVAVVRIESAAVEEPAPAPVHEEQQVFTMGAGDSNGPEAPEPAATVGTGLTIAHPAELSA